MEGFGAGTAGAAAAVLDGVLAGGDPAFHLRALARHLSQVGSNTAALEVIRGVIALDSCPDWYEDTHALILMGLARWDEARAAIDRLAVVDPTQAGWMRAYLGALVQPFGFWPAADPATDSGRLRPFPGP